MVICEITIVPLGTADTSVSSYVAACHQIVVDSGLTYQLTPMSTIIEGDLDLILEVFRKMHEVPFVEGANRVSTTLRIDDRRDKISSMKYKMDAVTKKLK